MEINWNFIELMRKGRETYINNKTFHEFFEKNCDIKVNDNILDVGLEQSLAYYIKYIRKV